MKSRNQLRIIGGQWKSRRIRFAAGPSLRPSPDAVRETLFNWLPHDLGGMTCLDLFAGSGALGLEAASRGAQRVVLVESDPRTAARLRQTCVELDASARVAVVGLPVARFLRNPPSAGESGVDLVFMDPPFDGVALAPTIAALQPSGWLRRDALVYIESPRNLAPPLPIPPSWRMIKRNCCGVVASALFQT